MKSSFLISLCAATLAAGSAHPRAAQVILQESQQTIVDEGEYLIELAPGETRWITEDEKWELRKVGYTDHLIYKCNHRIPCMYLCDIPLTSTSKTSTSSTSQTTRISALSTASSELRA